ncbi:MAG: putative nicotinamide N-methyase [Oceanicoccus sp.]|jgi:predicted nicotinamide N-methyase
MTKANTVSNTQAANSNHYSEAYGVSLLKACHKDLRQLKKQQQDPSIHGNKFWGSSYLIMDYLAQNPMKTNCKVLELGCGWGLAGIYCAKTFAADVTAIDADRAVFPFLHLHAKHNDVSIKTKQQYFEAITGKQLAEYDLIIGADICFWDELGETVFKLIKRACKAGVDKIIIADPQRAPFTNMAERCVEEFYADLESWAVDEPRRATGSLLIIENA